MKPEPRWIPLQAILDLHGEQLAMHGGAPGVRDMNSLKSALARPRHLFSYDEVKSPPALAAAYAFGIARNHPFVDGNKRMALLAMAVFMGLNGLYLDAREEEAYSIMMRLADGDLPEKELASWIADNSAVIEF